ncbi:hypothetical protein K3495_g8059 [Podosphaera aphanis]|nr:hypothetical protein K3495_g8059 [Podosphaera aphanis]
MEEYVNAMKLNIVGLETKQLLPPKKLLIAFIVDGLTSKYDSVAGNIIQSMRHDVGSYNTESSFASLLDESRRLSKREDAEDELALVALYRGQNAYSLS